jgi:hypothetical protein
MSMLYDINFIIGLLITLMLSTFAYFYFSQKIDEQKEKLNAVSMVVRAMAEEMAYFRNAGQAAFLEKVPLTKEGGDLTETKVFEIGLANIGINGSTNILGGGNNLEERSNELQLIAVSDDEDSGSDSDSQSESDSSDEDNESDVEDDDTELCSVSNMDVDVEVEDLEMLDGDLINQGVTDYKKEENNGTNGNIKSIKLDMSMDDLEEFGIFEGLGETACKPDVTETKVVEVEVAGLQPLTEDDQMKADPTDYKKMPLSKLRSIVVEKKLCEDASKMKKPELLELLKPFIGNID